MRLLLCPYPHTNACGRQSNPKNSVLDYGPSYWLLSGYSEEKRTFCPEALNEGRLALVDHALADFWKHMEAHPYAPSGNLYQHVTPRLRDYIASGINSECACFSPAGEFLALYLYGKAGTGKTTFVSAFAKALEASIRSRVEPGRQVQIVKVPLNSTTPAQLKSVLSVRVCASRVKLG